ncbi:gastrula zinc finger protein XlCGF49.1-like [Heterodontus francisci]|uniref:gastrula zinc finger protein XlCGF49.1-like n=1 Tax=Heterodontus francisci TaxID=7792 RepID=UPI00355B539F
MGRDRSPAPCVGRDSLIHAPCCHTNLFTQIRELLNVLTVRRFKSKNDLLQHQRTHSGERPFTCSVCGKGFTQPSHLHAHQLVHTDDRPFYCSDCEKSFKSKNDLLQHQRAHTGEKPFTCSVCGKGFSRSSRVLRHQQVHTREKPFSCSLWEGIHSVIPPPSAPICSHR